LTLFQKRIKMSHVENDWVLLPYSAYLRDLRWYAKKRPAELAAILRNLERYMTLLARSPSVRSIHAGFIHPEPHGMVALDHRGGAGRLQETRFIVMPIPAVAPSISSVLATNPPSLLTWLAFHPSPAP
jgi:hypothetical protein